MARELIAGPRGGYVTDGGSIVDSVESPDDEASIVSRMRARRTGGLTDEESAVASRVALKGAVTRDRRLVSEAHPLLDGLRSGRPLGLPRPPLPLVRAAVLTLAEEALMAARDPSLHVQEAIRAMGELDDILNRIGERLTNWAQHDAPLLDADDAEALHATALRLAEAESESTGEPLPERITGDPELVQARRSLAQQYLALQRTRREIESAVETALPHRAPNLTHLLGPLLAARLLSQAGGIDRLARLPASTIQVLGAERAFFEHLRGRAPPPRHGLLFLHPDLQGAPRRQRGKLARALAGKVAIAARMDREGAPLRAQLKQEFEARRSAIKSAGGKKDGTAKTARSRPPLDRAAQDR